MRKLSLVLTKSGAFLLGSTILCTSGTALAQQNNTDDDRDIVYLAEGGTDDWRGIGAWATAIGCGLIGFSDDYVKLVVGIASAVTTSGNPDCHIILRGGEDGPNYGADDVAETRAALEAAKLKPA